jgi:hypothetical protein
MTAFWIGLAALIVVPLLVVQLQDRRRRGGRSRGSEHPDDGGAARQRLKEYRRQAIAESGFIVPSGMTHEVRNNGQRR